jgi:hypothetical protein
VIIGTDIGMNQIEHELMVDPYKIFGRLRLSRGGSIQTEVRDWTELMLYSDHVRINTTLCCTLFMTS